MAFLFSSLARNSVKSANEVVLKGKFIVKQSMIF
jgi:hypothetical protein